MARESSNNENIYNVKDLNRKLGQVEKDRKKWTAALQAEKSQKWPNADRIRMIKEILRMNDEEGKRLVGNFKK